MTPLDMFIDRWNSVGMLAPFFDVINKPVELDDMPDIWASAIYHTPNRAEVTMGSKPFVQEDGTIIVALFARAGTGRSVLDPLIEQVRRYFAGWASGDTGDTAARCYFLQVNGPEDLNPETDGNWWQVALTVPYEVFTNSTTWNLPAPGAPPVIVDEDVDAWVAAVNAAGGTVSAERQALMVVTVKRLKDGGAWSRLECLWFHAAENVQQATIDLITRKVATPGPFPVAWQANYGFKSSVTSGVAFLDGDYVSYNFVPANATKYKVDDCHYAAFNPSPLMFVDEMNNISQFGVRQPVGGFTGAALIYMLEQATLTRIAVNNTDEYGDPFFRTTNDRIFGYYVQGIRPNLKRYYTKNAAPVQEVEPAVGPEKLALNADPFYGVAANGSYHVGRPGSDIAVAHFGASLTDSEALTCYAAISDFMIAAGGLAIREALRERFQEARPL